MRLLVTGATGFVGRATCVQLLARGHEVVALVRHPGSQPPGTEGVGADLRDTGSLSVAIDAARADVVIHLAAEIASQRDPGRIHDVNVEGTRRLLDGCRTSGVCRVVLASTVVTGDARGALLDEDSPLPVETAYGRSKQEAEQLVREADVEGIVVRPSHVYGPGGWYAEEFVGRLRQPGRFTVIGRGDNLWDVVHVDDVAGALVVCAERAPAGATYHVVDDEPITFYDFVALTASELGVGRPRRIPAWLARLAAGRDPVTAVLRSARSSNARIKRELGWSARYPSAREGVPAAVAALRLAA